MKVSSTFLRPFASNYANHEGVLSIPLKNLCVSNFSFSLASLYTTSYVFSLLFFFELKRKQLKRARRLRRRPSTTWFKRKLALFKYTCAVWRLYGRQVYLYYKCVQAYRSDMQLRV
jgi:hypothetical protein